MHKKLANSVLATMLFAGTGLMALNAPTQSAFAQTNTDSIVCAAEVSVGDKLANVNLKSNLYGYDFNTGTMGELDPATAAINEYSYVKQDLSARLNNDGTLKAGDYFVYQLPQAARLGGYVTARSVVVPNLYATDENGNEELFAVAEYNYETNTITYRLTSFIEGKSWVDFEISDAYLVKPDVVTNNGPHEFISSIGSTTHTAKYNVDFSGNKDNVYQNNTFSLRSTILGLDQPTKTYEQVVYLNPKGTAIKAGSTASYFTRDGLTPLTNPDKVRIYEVPDTYTMPDSAAVDVSQLTDVTKSFNPVTGEGTVNFTFPEDTTKRYVFYITNEYKSEMVTDANGNQIENVAELVSGISVDNAGDNAPNHAATSRLMAQQLEVTGQAGPALPASYCDRPRTITIKKSSSSTSAPLAGATFTVTNAEGVVVATVTTDETGTAVTEELPLGEYQVQEVTAPEGYILNGTTQTVILERTSNATVEFGMANDPVPTPLIVIPVPVPGGNNTPSPAATTPVTPATTVAQPQKAAQASQAEGKRLANTGVSVGAIALLAALLVGSGVALTIVRKRVSE